MTGLFSAISHIWNINWKTHSQKFDSTESSFTPIFDARYQQKLNWDCWLEYHIQLLWAAWVSTHLWVFCSHPHNNWVQIRNIFKGKIFAPITRDRHYQEKSRMEGWWEFSLDYTADVWINQPNCMSYCLLSLWDNVCKPVTHRFSLSYPENYLNTQHFNCQLQASKEVIRNEGT